MSTLLSILKYGLAGNRVSEMREAARGQLRYVKVTSTVPTLDLDCSASEVIDESENVVHSDGRVDSYYLTQVVRNQAGEYFLLKTTDGEPYIKYLPQERARVVLKAKYVAPTAQPKASDA